jgi:hypothetical protein
MGSLPKMDPNMENEGNTVVAKESDKNKQNVQQTIVLRLIEERQNECKKNSEPL